MDTKLKKGTTFHPQTNGQIEVVNKKMIQLFIVYCSKHPKIWDEDIEQYAQDIDFKDVCATLSHGKQVEQLDFHVKDQLLYYF